MNLSEKNTAAFRQQLSRLESQVEKLRERVEHLETTQASLVCRLWDAEQLAQRWKVAALGHGPTER